MEDPKEQRRYDAALIRQEKQKQLFLETIIKTGNIEATCQKIGISRQTYYRWIVDDKKFERRAYAGLRMGIDVIGDAIEGKLVSKALNGDFGAQKFFLTHNHQRYAKNAPHKKKWFVDN